MAKKNTYRKGKLVRHIRELQPATDQRPRFILRAGKGQFNAMKTIMKDEIGWITEGWDCHVGVLVSFIHDRESGLLADP
jgi:hypothetical protein